MDPAKVAFVFGDGPRGEDANDEEERHRLVKQRVLTDWPSLDDGSLANTFLVFAHQLVADQIVEDDPPEVWQTARRLLDSGLEAKFVMSNLVFVANSALATSIRDGEPLDVEQYIEELQELPLPPVREMFEMFVSIALDQRSVTSDELIAKTCASFGGVSDASDGDVVDNIEHWVEMALDELLDMEPSVMMLSPDLIVHVPTLLDGATLTHRLTESELAAGWVVTGSDLAPLLCRADELFSADGSEIEIDFLGGSRQGILEGADGWLEQFQPGTLIAFRLDGDTLITESVEDPGPPTPSVVDAARAAYEREVREPWLPVRADEIVAGMLLEHPSILSTPKVPISELLANAGLEGRGVVFAHEESVWRHAHRHAQTQRLYERLSDQDSRRRAARVIMLLDTEQRGSDEMREALSTLRDPHLLAALTDELLDLDDEESQLQEVSEFANDLIASARRPAEGAPARTLLAVVYERRCDPLAGQAQLELAVQADPAFAPAVDRLAWYLSDRGDAARAARLWRRLGYSEEEHDDLREVAQFIESQQNDLGRNDPCWCGSGRKFKHCHLGEPQVFPLPERVGWLCRKAVAYLQRRGGGTLEDVLGHAIIRADGNDSEEALNRAFSDPMLMDAVLHEGGWFEGFISERGALLPDDEAILATAWALVDRTLYEAVEVRAGEGLVVRDLRTAELIEVRERAFSRKVRAGQIFCGRAVPDGEQHQFIGGLFGVATGEEKDLLNLLDEHDSEELLSWVAAKERPPRLATREKEDLRACRVELEVPDPEAARAVLNQHYEARGGGKWSEHHQLANGESVLRASITLKRSRITVETMSEPRVERVLNVLRGEIAETKLISDKRDEIDLSNPPPGPAQAALSKDDPGVKEMLRNFIAKRERIWCDEEIPALGGLTPRQAAADPVGRESLERLLEEYGSHVDPQEDPELVPQYPERLRQLLGLL
jgi:hypothetical protein